MSTSLEKADFLIKSNAVIAAETASAGAVLAQLREQLAVVTPTPTPPPPEKPDPPFLTATFGVGKFMAGIGHDGERTTGYRLKWSGPQSGEAAIAANALSHTVSPLASGMYTVTLTAVGPGGESDPATATGEVKPVIIVGDDNTPYPIPANVPRIDPGADWSKIPVVAACKPGGYVMSGGWRPGQVIYSTAIAERAVCKLKDGQILNGKDVANVKLFGVGWTGGGQGVSNHQMSVLCGNAWLLEYVLVEKTNYGGICFEGDDCIIRHAIVRDCGSSGIGGNSPNNYLEEDCLVELNNYRNMDKNGGGGKFLKAKNLVFRRRTCRKNKGSGLWLDWNNVNFLIDGGEYGGQVHWIGSGNENSQKYDRFGTARDIYIEGSIAGSGTIQNILFTGSEGARIEIAESLKINVLNNVLRALAANASNSTRRKAGICYRDIERPDLNDQKRSNMLQQILVSGNRFEGTDIQPGDGGGGVRKGKNNLTHADNIFTDGGQDKIPA